MIAAGTLYALMISGTRSAVAVPLAGFVVFAFLSKKFKIMAIMGFFVLSAFVFLKYTTIGQGNYDIRRMRSAFSDDNASMNVRNENRKMFADYLRTRPFGGGIGSAGNWGLRFSPDTFLAQTATDGWYVQIWAETGIVGLLFYFIMILYMAFKSILLIFFRLKKPENINISIAFVSGIFGLMVSSYTSSALGQMPNTIIVFTAFVFISLMPGWEKDEHVKLKILNQNQK
jgi:O-antigen ligase